MSERPNRRPNKFLIDDNKNSASQQRSSVRERSVRERDRGVKDYGLDNRFARATNTTTRPSTRFQRTGSETSTAGLFPPHAALSAVKSYKDKFPSADPRNQEISLNTPRTPRHPYFNSYREGVRNGHFTSSARTIREKDLYRNRLAEKIGGQREGKKSKKHHKKSKKYHKKSKKYRKKTYRRKRR